MSTEIKKYRSLPSRGSVSPWWKGTAERIIKRQRTQASSFRNEQAIIRYGHPKIKVSLFILKPLKNLAVEIELANYKNPKLKKVYQIFNKEKIKKHTEYTKARAWSSTKPEF